MSHFIIVGAGECGARAAFALREKGFAGNITLIGDEPVAPYERPPLSKHSEDEGLLPKFVAELARYSEAGIVLRLGETVTELDATGKLLTLSSGETLAFDKLLLATGARARPFPGLILNEHGRIRALRTHADAIALKELASIARLITYARQSAKGMNADFPVWCLDLALGAVLQEMDSGMEQPALLDDAMEAMGIAARH